MKLSKEYINKIIDKGYKSSHDIEMVATSLYSLILNKKSVDLILIEKFIRSINESMYPNVIDITCEYLERLVNYDGVLLYEEFLKISHLFNSINILFFLYNKNDIALLTEVDDLFLAALKKYPKWYKALLAEQSNDIWWNRIRKKLAIM